MQSGRKSHPAMDLEGETGESGALGATSGRIVYIFFCGPLPPPPDSSRYHTISAPITPFAYTVQTRQTLQTRTVRWFRCIRTISAFAFSRRLLRRLPSESVYSYPFPSACQFATGARITSLRLNPTCPPGPRGALGYIHSVTNSPGLWLGPCEIRGTPGNDVCQ